MSSVTRIALNACANNNCCCFSHWFTDGYRGWAYGWASSALVAVTRYYIYDCGIFLRRKKYRSCDQYGALRVCAEWFFEHFSLSSTWTLALACLARVRDTLDVALTEFQVAPKYASVAVRNVRCEPARHAYFARNGIFEIRGRTNITHFNLWLFNNNVRHILLCHECPFRKATFCHYRCRLLPCRRSTVHRHTEPYHDTDFLYACPYQPVGEFSISISARLLYNMYKIYII